MRKFITLMVLLTAGAASFAQVTISGKVKDNKGRPINAASISLKDSYDGAVADSMGNYHFTTTEKGSFLFQVSCAGYKPFEQQITIGTEPIKINVAPKKDW